jgi:formate dehydrogenase subunit delta
MSSAQHLAQMANDIGNFFRAQGSRDEAIAGIANHLRSYWTRRMKDDLRDFSDQGGDIDELPRAALYLLSEQPNSIPKQTPGGDAG